MSESWFVVQTLGGREGSTEKEIKRRDWPTFYPQEERTVLHARRSSTVLRPLYPTYLFVQFDSFDLSWNELLHVPGVYTILGMTRPMGRPKFGRDDAGANWIPFRGQPRPLPEGVVEFIKAYLRDGVLPEVHEELEHLEKDTEVMILGGAFDQWIGLVDAQVDERVSVLLDIFGRSTPTIVARDSVATVFRPS